MPKPITSIYTSREAVQMADMLDELRAAEADAHDAEQMLQAFYDSHREEEQRLVTEFEAKKARAKRAAWMMSRVGNTLQAEALRRYAAEGEQP